MKEKCLVQEKEENMHKKAGTKRKAKAVGSVVLTACLTASMGTSAFADTGASANKYFNDYNSEEEALDAARALNKELSEEGNVLLKNDGTLPLNGTERISVFGVSSDSLVGGSANSSVNMNISKVVARPFSNDCVTDQNIILSSFPKLT